MIRKPRTVGAQSHRAVRPGGVLGASVVVLILGLSGCATNAPHEAVPDPQVISATTQVVGVPGSVRRSGAGTTDHIAPVRVNTDVDDSIDRMLAGVDPPPSYSSTTTVDIRP